MDSILFYLFCFILMHNILFSEIPEGTKQVCTTCFGRINKRISQAQEDEVARDTNSTNSRDTKETYKVGEVIWSNEEVTLLEMALRELGTDWAKIASKVPDKKASECKKFFYAHRKKLGLNEMVADYKKSVGASNGDKPSLSSDEEYSTSSCDDENDKQNDKKTGNVLIFVLEVNPPVGESSVGE